MTKRIEAVLITLLVVLTSGAVWPGDFVSYIKVMEKSEKRITRSYLKLERRLERHLVSLDRVFFP